MFCFRLWLLLVFGIVHCSQNIDPYLNVITSSGPVRGNLLFTAIETRPYYSFKGIPYAHPPANTRRFLPPVPVEKWKTTRDCFAFGSVCLQFNPLNKTQLIGDEDCLFLNIYIPAGENNIALKPVMVYFHGGAFFFGSGNDDLQGPDLLIEEGVILVTMNYRLGVLGFMSLGTPEYSGNQGLKDQQLALKWIQLNIRRFGGDPTGITIFGQSAGSASSLFHMYAPGSRGLFRQTIQMSSTFDIWTIFQKRNNFQDMRQFAIDSNINISYYAELVDFLINVDAVNIITAFPIVQFYPDRSPIEITSKWLPIVEDASALEPFLVFNPTHPLFRNSFDQDINVMLGYTTSESLFYNSVDCNHPDLLDNFNKNFAIVLPSIYFNRDYNSTNYRRAAAKIRDYYFPNGIAVNANRDSIQSFVELMSNVFQNYPIDRRARLLANHSRAKVFFYRFGLISALNYFKNTLGVQTQYGASHADDVCYVFHCSLIKEAYQLGNNQFLKTMPRLFANFAKRSNPIPGQLEPATTTDLHFVDITNNGLKAGVNPLAEIMKFWTYLLYEFELL